MYSEVTILFNVMYYNYGYLGTACPELSKPSHGRVKVETQGHTDVAAYSCRSRYRLSGPANRTCQPDGNWSDLEPHCVRKFKILCVSIH